MQIPYSAAQVGYLAPQHVRDCIVSLGRTEDIRFSPSNRRLAVAGFAKNKIAIFEVSANAPQTSKSLCLTGVTEFSSSALSSPHGLDFIDDEIILVTNREGDACIFKLPVGATGRYELTPFALIRSDVISTPGSVIVTRRPDNVYEALICNNYVHTVARHLVDLKAGHLVSKSEVLLKRWLNTPDGISVSRDMNWIAVSNHGTHAVLLYENDASLNRFSNPIGILRRTDYPHGLRFTSDGRFILVADAGSPYVRVYGTDSGWRGVRDPLISIRVLKQEDFLRCRYNPAEGGPKGIDINYAHKILVTTCEAQPLAFFDLTAILEMSNGALNRSNDAAHKSAHRPAATVRRELYLRQAAVVGRALLNPPSYVRAFRRYHRHFLRGSHSSPPASVH